MQDLRFALRHLVKAPGFAMTAILTMTLGFGAAVAIYAFVDAALVAPCRCVARTAGRRYRRNARFPMPTCHIPTISTGNSTTRSFGFDFHNAQRYALSTSDGVQAVRGVRVSAGFFARLEWHRFAAAISTKARTSRGSRRRPLSATRRGTVGLAAVPTLSGARSHSMAGRAQSSVCFLRRFTLRRADPSSSGRHSTPQAVATPSAAAIPLSAWRG